MKELHLTTPFLSRSEGQDYVSQRLVRLAARQMKAQVPDAWPNLFREARFLSAVNFVQSDRPRRRVAGEMARIFGEVDLLLVPSLRDEMLTIGNFTGHPSLTFRAGFVQVSEARSDWAPDPAHPLPKFSPPRRVPHGVTLIGRLFDEGTIGRVGVAMERALGACTSGPPDSDVARNPESEIPWFNEGGRHGARGPQSAGPSGENRGPAAAGRPG
jgi:Asp-tRNA(Asn)/Glu-tRNA(Gln) amidotransferase A subunit family amidase